MSYSESKGEPGNKIYAINLGDKEFKKDYNIKYAYLTGGMYRGVASKDLVVKMGKAGMMAFLGTGGLELGRIEEDIIYIQSKLNNREAYGMNLLYNHMNPKKEESTVDLYLKYGVRNVEVAGYMNINTALVKYRLNGLIRDSGGAVTSTNRIIAKVSRPEMVKAFLTPAPDIVVKKLLEENRISRDQAEMAKYIPMADDITVETDSGGHTDFGVAYTLVFIAIKIRNEMMKTYNYKKNVRIGTAGGIGVPEAAAAAFIMGADYIVTGSINQCTVESGTSDIAKDMLQDINIKDTDYCPAGDMFELGSKVQVLKKGVFFPARANMLYELYCRNNSLEEIDEKTKKQIQEKFFKKSFNEVYEECKNFYPPHEIEKAEKNPKYKMAVVFKWYFWYSTNLALNGIEDRSVDFQIHCGPALGAFNQWVKGTELENWRNRHVDLIAVKLMESTAQLLTDRFNTLTEPGI